MLSKINQFRKRYQTGKKNVLQLSENQLITWHVCKKKKIVFYGALYKDIYWLREKNEGEKRNKHI